MSVREKGGLFLGCLFMIGILIYGIAQIWAGFLGISHHFGNGWAIAAVLMAFAFRFSLPLTIGSFFGAMNVWGWHWLAALVFAAPSLAFMALMIPGALGLIMKNFKRLFRPAKQRTMLDDVQESGGKIVVAGYRSIAAQCYCAPTQKTTDQKIIEIYSKVCAAFYQAGEQRGEHIPAVYLNTIALKFFQVYEMLGEERLEEHLRYEIEKYLSEGLRDDYKQELQLF